MDDFLPDAILEQTRGDRKTAKGGPAKRRGRPAKSNEETSYQINASWKGIEDVIAPATSPMNDLSKVVPARCR
jgi:hypothetical protein